MSVHLTKSRYMAGLQCLRRLWLLVHEPPPYDDPPPGSVVAMGQEIGRKAHLLFPGGVLVDEEPWQHAEAAARTAALMADGRVPAIFEAAFEYDGIRIRVDVIERLGRGAWGLREVKSSAGLKDHYIDDIALQAFVLRGAGVSVASIELVHVNTAYVRGADGICWSELFARLDLGEAVADALVTLPDRLPAMRDCLASATAPVAEPGGQCSAPYECEFWDQCTVDKPADWIIHLPYLSQARASELKALGIEAISAIPAEFPLTWNSATLSSRWRRRCAPVSATTISGLSPTAWRRQGRSCSWPPAVLRVPRKPLSSGPHSSPTASAIRWPWSRRTGRWPSWRGKRMVERSAEGGMVGPFWVVEDGGKSSVIALAVPLERADTYGDMLTVDTGHLEHRSRLARRGAPALRADGLPTAPVWSEYEEWPRGRVLYDGSSQRFVIRADRQLHRLGFVHLIATRFYIEGSGATILPDDHYRSIRRVPLPCRD